jgi:5-bromo-4-chloroindolyl phosphate hydrolysis protein
VTTPTAVVPAEPLRPRQDRPGASAERTIRRVRAWAPAAKAVALFLLPAPLLIALVANLVSDRALAAAFSAGALGALWTGGVLVMRALAAEARYLLGERLDPPTVPWKLLSAALTAAGVSLAAMAGGHAWPVALVFATLAVLGHLAFYGRDLRPPRIRVAEVDGIDGSAVALQLKQAHARLRGIVVAANQVPEFRERLTRVADLGHGILGEIERDPAKAARARRFLNVYLDGAERISAEYARTHHEAAQPLEQNFRKLLTEMETNFAEQRRRLAERDLTALDVDIEVLHARLKGEGIAGPSEHTS